jgi:hypothetical protein
MNNNPNTNTFLGPPPPPPKWSTLHHGKLHLWLFNRENQNKLLEFCDKFFPGRGIYFSGIVKIERPLHIGYNRAYLAYMADAIIDTGNKIAIICQLKPHFTDTVTDTLSQINKYKACLADEPFHDQITPNTETNFI